MPAMASGASASEHAMALDALRPEGFGFRPYRDGWVRDFAGLGTVAVARLSWQHAHAPSYEQTNGERLPTDALGFLVALQRATWGMPPEDLVPANILAVLADTGGSALVAYDLAKGFNADGWLGFVFGLGARSGTLVSHMLGVREEVRGAWDLGWHLKVLQGFHALATHHTAATWTFDPMRGANARLNLEKLGAEVREFAIDKYGTLRSALYGENVPSDRLIATWDLVAPATAERIRRVRDRHYPGLSPDDIAALPEATPATLAETIASCPNRLRVAIPGDIDRLMKTDPSEAMRRRQELRAVLSALLTTRSARVGDAGVGPLAVEVRTQPGDYVIDGFATGLDPSGERLSSYLLERRPS